MQTSVGMDQVGLSESKKKDTAYFFLKDRQPSDFIKEGTKGTKHEERLDAPGIFCILNTSYRVEEKDGKRVQIAIRHIKGCDEIDVDKQDKMNIKPNGNEDKIFIHNGKFIVSDEAETRGLYNYLTNNIAFQEAPNRNPSTPVEYYRHYPAKEAERDLRKMAEVNRARTLVGDLYADTIKGFVYNEKKIDFLCRVTGVKADSYEEKTATLMQLAEDMPAELINSCSDVINEFKAIVAEAQELQVISYEGKAVKMNNGEIQTDLFKLSGNGKNEDERMMEVVYFFTNSINGKEMYGVVLNAMDDRKKKKLGKE